MAVAGVDQAQVVEQDVVVRRRGGGGAELALGGGRIGRLGIEAEHVVELTDEIARQVVLGHTRVVLACERGRGERAALGRDATAYDPEGEPRGDDRELGEIPVGVVGEVEPVRIGIEVERRAGRLADALRDEIEVGAQAFDVAEVEQDEEDVVVARHEVRAGREPGEELPAVVLRDPVAAAVERSPVRRETHQRQHEQEPGEPAPPPR